jgi:hypothetical protein
MPLHQVDYASPVQPGAQLAGQGFPRDGHCPSYENSRSPRNMYPDKTTRYLAKLRVRKAVNFGGSLCVAHFNLHDSGSGLSATIPETFGGDALSGAVIRVTQNGPLRQFKTDH